jgi:hypothetical protein
MLAYLRLIQVASSAFAAINFRRKIVKGSTNRGMAKTKEERREKL